MRLLTVLALLQLVLTASPVLAQADDLSSEGQTGEYGRLFGYVCAAASFLGVVLFVAHVIKGMVAEAARGKKTTQLPEAMLDEAQPKKKKKEILYLGEKVPDWKMANRLPAIKAALKFLSAKDAWFDRKDLEGVVFKAYRAYKNAVELRSTKKAERLLTAECLEDLKTEIGRLKKKGELHLFGNLEITEIQVVQFEAPTGKANHTFTALISVKSRDFYQDEKSGDLLRGDKKYYIYQEFWRFRRSSERWLVERIRPSADMDVVLHTKNVMAQADLDQFAKKSDPDFQREFIGK